MNVTERVKNLQDLMAKHKLDAYVVPSADPHQSEYVADAWKRREFISGFSGSAGLFACTKSESGLWTDGRYFVQAETELSGSPIRLYRQGQDPDWKEWLANKLPSGSRLGVNLSLFSIGSFRGLEDLLAQRKIEIVAQEDDLVDQVWKGTRPQLPSSPFYDHPLQYAGVDRREKLQNLRKAMKEVGAKSLIVSALDEIAWLFNLRGSDVSYNPVFYAFAVIHEDGATLFASKIDDKTRQALSPDIKIADYNSFADALGGLQAASPVWLDGNTISAWVERKLRALRVPLLIQNSPIPAWKAMKNPAELSGMKAAHVRDGVAMLRFLHWFSEAIKTESLTENSVADKLETFRRQQSHYKGPSFSTISAYGPHGALPHYRATAASNAKLEVPGIFLIDSGGQYDDGTTDITRTISLGAPSDFEKRVYTTVLKGHLLLARSLFPVGTNGYQLDVLARQPLWKDMLDYNHGTGHGVGAALCVHEGPFSVSLRKNLFPLAVGHILSNEPGCYLVNQFGVRIENLVTVVKKGEHPDFGDFLGFEDLTLCPYDRHLIDKTLLSSEDIAQVNQYQQRVRQELSPFLDESDRAYLKQQTEPL